MKKDELASKLQKHYAPSSDCGVERGQIPEYQNTWFVISPPPPKKITFSLDLEQLRAANKIIARLSPLKGMSELDKLLSYLFVKKEALSSSRMEGTWSTMDLLLSPVHEDADDNEKSDRDSILQYAQVLNELATEILNNKFQFTHKVIKRIHHDIMTKDPKYKGAAGEYRKNKNKFDYVFIGGKKIENSVFNPTPPHFVKESMEKFLEWIADEDFIMQSEIGTGIPFLVRLAMAHTYFEAIHPFRDGNGRVGRVILALQMMAEGYSPLYLSGYIEAHKENYVEALEQAQKKLNYLPIISFIADSVIYSAKEIEENKTALVLLQKRWADKLKPRKNSAAEKILSKLIEHPIFTAQQILQWFDLSKPAVYNAIEQLKVAKIIRERTQSERNKVFAAEEVVEIISRDYDDSIEEALGRAGELLKV